MADKLYAQVDVSDIVTAEDYEDEIQPEVTTQTSSTLEEDDS